MMIKTKKELKECLKYEAKKYGQKYPGGGSIACFLKCCAGSEKAILWRFQKRLRITEYHHNAGHRILYAVNRILLNKKRNKYGMHIGLNVFDNGLRIMHLGPILTNEKARVGKDCAIHINTALVAQGVKDDSPTLGNDIVIGVGAVIVGGVHIANGIAIGANAVVNKSFAEENIAIAGVPAHKVSNNGSLNWNKAAKTARE